MKEAYGEAKKNKAVIEDTPKKIKEKDNTRQSKPGQNDQ